MRVHLCLLLCCAVLTVLSFAAAGPPSLEHHHRHQRSSPLTRPASASTSLSPNDYPPTVPAFHPLANPAAIVTVGNARFTVLTSHMIRLEYSASRQFQDAATWVAVNRNLTVPMFKVSSNDTHTVIATSAVTVTYLTAASTTFNSSNIRVEATYSTGRSVESGGSGVRQASVAWSAINQEETAGNLLGTYRTLDGNSGDDTAGLECKDQNVEDSHCTYGVVSRNGYALIDDSHRPSFDNSEWPWIQPTVWTSPPSDQCQLADADKRDCGYVGIDGRECTMRGCCWTGGEQTAAAGTPACFYSQQADQDLYFLGHGHDYKLAIKEFTLLAGDIPLPPRYTFGIFFSRYW
jgi:alpha-glucosidase (family GH31 glycosyl hydrolase)